MLLFFIKLADGLVFARGPGLAGLTAFFRLRPFDVNINLTVPFFFVLALKLLLFGVYIFIGPSCAPAVTAFFCKLATLLGR